VSGPATNPGARPPRRRAETPRPTQRYDVAVVGNALPGLVAAALLAQRGLRVLHVAAVGGGTYEAGGFRLPSRPELLPAPKHVPVVRETLEELALAAPVQRSLQPAPAQFVLPRARFELDSVECFFGTGANAALAQLASDAETLAPLVAAPPLLPRTLGERLRLWNHARANRARFLAPLDLGAAAALAEPLLALHRFATADRSPPLALGFARATAPLLQGLHRLPEGGLAAQLVGHVRARRGDALVARVEAVQLERGHAAGLQIGGELWRARSVLAALPVPQLLPLLPEGRRTARLRALGEGARALPLHVRNLVLARDGVPPALGPLAVATRDGAAALFERRPALRTDGSEDPAAATITVSSYDEGALDDLIEDVLPFHGPHVLHRSDSPDPGAGVDLAVPRPNGFEGLPVATPVPGLFLAGPELLPALGLEGAFLAGRALAARVQAIAGRERP